MKKFKKQTDISQLQQIVRNVPETKKLKDWISISLKILETLLNKFEEMNHKNISEIEQNILTGYTANGAKYSAIHEDVKNILENKTINYDDKLRIFILYKMIVKSSQNDNLASKYLNISPSKVKNVNVNFEFKNNFKYTTNRFVPLTIKAINNFLNKKKDKNIVS